MPTYEYACPTCGIVEVFQSIKEDALKKCPKCKKQNVTRIISGGGGVIFKGSGFWETDYNRSSDYESKSKAEKGDKAEAKEPSPQSKGQAEPKKADPVPATTTSSETKKSDVKPAADKPASDKPGAKKPEGSSSKTGPTKPAGPGGSSGGPAAA
jgi:putative FmdB family regulatory protein